MAALILAIDKLFAVAKVTGGHFIACSLFKEVCSFLQPMTDAYSSL